MPGERAGNMDYFKAMDSFVRVARAGSFTAAAVETGM
jgi:DNA-binding transcriptional LysR family regulator